MMRLTDKIVSPLVKRVSFPVNRKHMILGERCSSTRCPVALAMKDAGLKEPSVLPTIIYYTDVDGHRRIAHPTTECKDWIRLFDGGYQVEPAQFELDGLEERLR